VRAFLAIAIAGPVVATLEHASLAISHSSPAWRGEKWVPAENLHITIRFLGDVPDDDAQALNALIAEVAPNYPVHDISLAGLAARPRARAANLVWATFGGQVESTAKLVDALSAALTAAGYDRPEHPFVPHATLVRARRPRSIDPDALEAARRAIEAASAQDRTMSVAEVTLFSSTLTAHGPRYRVLGTAGLKRD
jgi:2'-5' RNA ligase